MSNVDKPNGFHIVGTLNGGDWNAKVVKVYSDTNNLFLGDIVVMDTAGQTSGDGAYPTVDRMSNGATDIPYGVVVGWEPQPTALSNLYYAASTSYCCYVCIDPNVIMECQSDDNSITDATTIGLNYDVTIAAGSTTSGASNMELDGSSGVTTAATPLRLLGAVDRPNNDITAANNRWLVAFNLHKMKGEAGTAGV